MNADAALRIAAVVAAALIVAAPYWHVVAGWIAAATEAAREHRTAIKRATVAALLIGAGWGKVPLPRFTPYDASPIAVETPSEAMQATVAPIAKALSSAPMTDRMLWAQLWTKAAVVAAGDGVSPEVVFTDTRSLRLFTVLALDIGWRRLGSHAPGEYRGLREAVEGAFAAVLGKNETPVTKDLRARYAELCKAIAWAGMNGG